MKILHASLFVLMAAALSLQAQDAAQISNPAIDYKAFMANAAEVGKLRETRLLTEDQFLKMAAEPGTIIFDARNDTKYGLLHVKGSVHLDLTNITAADLAKVIPDKNTRILIYCNNNFDNEPVTMGRKTASRLVEHLHFQHPLQLRLQKRLRTRSAYRLHDDEDSFRGNARAQDEITFHDCGNNGVNTAPENPHWFSGAGSPGFAGGGDSAGTSSGCSASSVFGSGVSETRITLPTGGTE